MRNGYERKMYVMRFDCCGSGRERERVRIKENPKHYRRLEIGKTVCNIYVLHIRINGPSSNAIQIIENNCSTHYKL